MTENYDGVHELTLFYTCTISGLTIPHKMTFDVNVSELVAPGTPFNAITVQTRDVSFYSLYEWLLQETDWFMAKLLPCFANTAEFGRAELWRIPEGTYDGIFISSLELGLPGTSASPLVAAQQSTFTFRSIGGGIMRLQLMESSIPGNQSELPPYGTAVANALSAFVVSGDSCMLARDNTPPFARIKLSNGQNEKTFRQRFRAGT